MHTCSRCHLQSPDNMGICINCGADLKEWSESAVAIKRLQDNPRVIYVRVSVAENSCPTCKQAEGAYSKQDVPKIPIAGCSHEHGCRCFYLPVLDSIYP